MSLGILLLIVLAMLLSLVPVIGIAVVSNRSAGHRGRNGHKWAQMAEALGLTIDAPAVGPTLFGEVQNWGPQTGD